MLLTPEQVARIIRHKPSEDPEEQGVCRWLLERWRVLEAGLDKSEFGEDAAIAAIAEWLETYLEQVRAEERAECAQRLDALAEEAGSRGYRTAKARMFGSIEAAATRIAVSVVREKKNA